MDLVTLIMACSLFPDNSIIYAIINVDSHNNALRVTENGNSRTFNNEQEAQDFTQQRIAQHKNPQIGLMQIPYQQLTPMGVKAADVFYPCKNLVIGTQLLNKAYRQCETLSSTHPGLDINQCTLSVYKTGDPQQGQNFASQVLTYAAAHPFTALAAKAHDPAMINAAITEKDVANSPYIKASTSSSSSLQGG
jgi:hypothetical protein